MRSHLIGPWFCRPTVWPAVTPLMRWPASCPCVRCLTSTLSGRSARTEWNNWHTWQSRVWCWSVKCCMLRDLSVEGIHAPRRWWRIRQPFVSAGGRWSPWIWSVVDGISVRATHNKCTSMSEHNNSSPRTSVPMQCIRCRRTTSTSARWCDDTSAKISAAACVTRWRSCRRAREVLTAQKAMSRYRRPCHVQCSWKLSGKEKQEIRIN